MPRLKIYDLESGKGPGKLCLVWDVPMPDGTMRHYAGFGRRGLAEIIERISLDRCLVAERLHAKRKAA